MLLYDGKLKIDGQEIDTTNLDDAGWQSSVAGKKSWEFTAGAYWWTGAVPISEIGTRLLAKFYAIYATKSFVGSGAILNLENVVASTTEAQKQTITCKGAGEIYPE
jgi:hypothetical protein